MNTSSRFHLADTTCYWPVAAIGAFCLLGWMNERHGQDEKKQGALQILLADLTHSTEEQATEAFANGDFRRAAALLEPVSSSPTASPTTLLLQARALECLGRFAEAGAAYSRVAAVPTAQLTVLRGQKFCQRMASERRPVDPQSREFLYRLHEELTQRGDAPTARFIAEKLLPDTKPLRASVTTLLRALDPTAEIEPGAEPGRLNVTVRILDTRVLALLKNLKIGTLNVSRSGLDAPKVLAVLDVRALDLSFNGFSDLGGLRSLPLRRLDLHATRTADVRSLAGMPLGELNLANTMVSSLHALALCPLEKLNLSSTPIRNLDPLRGLALRELDLSHTRVVDLSALAGMPLERLALNDTPVVSLQHLKGAKLTSLSLAGTAIKNLEALQGMPLVELDLRGCELLNDLDPLAQCQHLERVFLPRHLKTPQAMALIPRVKFIEAGKPVTLAQE
jgi:hypothetical protein